MTRILYVLLQSHRGGTDTEIRVSTKSWPLRRKFFHHSCRDSNPQPFNHKSSALTTELSPPPVLVQNWVGATPSIWTAHKYLLQSHHLSIQMTQLTTRKLVLNHYADCIYVCTLMWNSCTPSADCPCLLFPSLPSTATGQFTYKDISSHLLVYVCVVFVLLVVVKLFRFCCCFWGWGGAFELVLLCKYFKGKLIFPTLLGWKH